MKRTKTRVALLSVAPLLIILILVEFGFRIIYFQEKSENMFAVQSVYYKLRDKVVNYKANRILKQLESEHKINSGDLLFTDEAKELLEQFQLDYEQYLQTLIKETKSVDALLVLLYIPQDDYNHSKSLEICRGFYKNLAQKHQIPFLDVTADFKKYPATTITLLPENGHLSRFGNKLVAQKLAKFLMQYQSKRSSVQFKQRPPLLGDLQPSSNRVLSTMPSIPFRVHVNAQGLRMNKDVEFPKKKQRVLILGDSYSYGPYLPDFHTYPHYLEQEIKSTEVLNAAVSGYTIADEVELFQERAKYSEPDIVVLQVLDNDLTGLFSFMRNQFDRKRRLFSPSTKETSLLQKLN